MTSSDPATPRMLPVLVVDDEPEIRPDLILLDVDMPRLRGIETLLVIRELSPETKVIMISGKADEAEARRALALGAFDYITKAFDLAYLRQVIEAAL